MPELLDRPSKTPRYLSQDRRITPKMLRFAELLGSGLDQGVAAKQAGYKQKTSASQALKHPLLQQYLSTIQSKTCVLAAYKAADAMQEAKQAMEFAYKTDNANAYCKAVELRAKLSGLLIERVEVVTVDLSGALQQASQRVLRSTAQAAMLDQNASTSSEQTRMDTGDA